MTGESRKSVILGFQPSFLLNHSFLNSSETDFRLEVKIALRLSLTLDKWEGDVWGQPTYGASHLSVVNDGTALGWGMDRVSFREESGAMTSQRMRPKPVGSARLEIDFLSCNSCLRRYI